jgi:hypothetical protein
MNLNSNVLISLNLDNVKNIDTEYHNENTCICELCQYFWESKMRHYRYTLNEEIIDTRKCPCLICIELKNLDYI